MYELHILDFEDTLVESMEFETKRQAEKAERGALINLDHNYYTEIVEKK